MNTNRVRYGSLFALAVLVCVLALSVCASAEPLPTTSLVGPKPADATKPPLTGYLKVYTVTREYNNGDVVYYPRRRYFLYDTAGAHRTIDNRTSRKDEEPQTIPLAVGKYYVVAESDNDGVVRIPVLIKAGKKTVVILSPGKSSDPDAKIDPSRAIRTPSGSIVGWAASS